jgi:hypothetical protein
LQSDAFSLQNFFDNDSLNLPDPGGRRNTRKHVKERKSMMRGIWGNKQGRV